MEHEIKDRILEHLFNNGKCDEYWVAIENLPKKIPSINSIDINKIRVSIGYMKSDRYVETLFADNAPDSVKITSGGIVFIRYEGGYTQQHDEEQRDKQEKEGEKTLDRRRSKWDRRRGWGLAILAVALGVLNILQYVRCH